MSYVRDLIVVKGDSADIQFSIVDTSGVAFDLTNWKVKFESGKTEKSSEDPSQIEITDAFGGKGFLHLEISDTTSFVSSQKYSMWIESKTEVNPDRFTVLCGRVKFQCLT
jgi:hypothetical protein